MLGCDIKEVGIRPIGQTSWTSGEIEQREQIRGFQRHRALNDAEQK